MIYAQHFGLDSEPFSLTPNVQYYFQTGGTENTVEMIEYAVRSYAGIIKVVGDVGTGKTLLCRLLLQKLTEKDRVAYINAPKNSAATVLRTLCAEFEIDVCDDDSVNQRKLYEFLIQKHTEKQVCAVVIDEAQHLGRDGLEMVRLISNLETETHKLLQIVMFGQPELDELLRDPSMRQLEQRIVYSFSTGPLTKEEVGRYIEHRISLSRIAGMNSNIFTKKAMDRIAAASRGVPRLVNILSQKSLLEAFAAQSPIIDMEHVVAAIRSTDALRTVKRKFSPFGWLVGLFSRLRAA